MEDLQRSTTPIDHPLRYTVMVDEKRGLRGDYFIDRLGGWTEVLLAATTLGIVLTRFKRDILPGDIAFAAMCVVEVAGAIAITRSKLTLMRLALWIFVLRVVGGMTYMSVIHGDKLARSTLGFPFVVALYCWARCRALKANP